VKKSILTLLFLLAVAVPAHAVLIGGVEFPDGAVSFADSVYSYAPGANVGPGYNNPNAALGTPDNSSVSLGINGSLILQFTDNSLTTSGDNAADLHIFEIGAVTEWMNVAISTDALSWIDLGNVLGQPSNIDIDPIAGVTPGTLYSYVRISDIPPNQSGYPWGEADIDAVGAISSAAPVPEPSTLLLLGSALFGIAAFRKKFN
jgi:hypothetical protein